MFFLLYAFANKMSSEFFMSYFSHEIKKLASMSKNYRQTRHEQLPLPKTHKLNAGNHTINGEKKMSYNCSGTFNRIPSFSFLEPPTSVKPFCQFLVSCNSYRSQGPKIQENVKLFMTSKCIIVGK